VALPLLLAATAPAEAVLLLVLLVVSVFVDMSRLSIAVASLFAATAPAEAVLLLFLLLVVVELSFNEFVTGVEFCEFLLFDELFVVSPGAAATEVAAHASIDAVRSKVIFIMKSFVREIRRQPLL